jgi:cystathionine beta-lyase
MTDTFAPRSRRETHATKWTFFEEDVLPMWVADMDFRSPEPVIRALTERVQHGVFGYQFDSPPLRQTLVERLHTRHHLSIQPDQILFIPGLVEALNLVCEVFGEHGGVLMQTPIYPPFLSAPANNGCAAQKVPLARISEGARMRYEIDFEAFEAAITPESRVFLLCNPHNPVGRVYTRAELERLAEICLRHNLLICADEIHCDLVYDGHQHLSIASLAPEIAARTITLLAPSKTFNLPGLGLGFAVVSDDELRARLTKKLWGMGAFVNALGYTAALAAYQEGQPWLDETMAYLKANRDFVVEFVETRLPGVQVTVPEGTYLAWLDMGGADISGSAYKFCLDHARVACGNGTDFAAGETFIRLNYGCPRDMLTDALERICAAVEEQRTRSQP